jgi:hypothetical protein
MEWIITCNLNYYNVVEAFNKFERVDWKQSTNIEKGDYIYIYVGKPYSAIKYKCVTTKVNLPNVEIDDSEFIIDGSAYVKHGRYMELKLVKKLDFSGLEFDKLKENGLQSVQGPSKLTPQLTKYINRVAKEFRAKEAIDIESNISIPENIEDARVISFPVGNTFEISKKTRIHAHPIKRGYPNKIIKFIVLRQKGGVMEEVYEVVNAVDLFPAEGLRLKNELSMDVSCRIEEYINKRNDAFGFGEKDTKYRFYVLNHFQDIDPPIVMNPNHQSYVYYDLDELVGKDLLKLESVVVTKVSEGRRKHYYTVKYERVPKNRTEAIRIHGLKCIVCGFDFEEAYGELGRGFIEVHHTKPLYTLDEEKIVNPETDLVCLCSNCHKMIHRRRNIILTVKELSEKVMKQYE